MWYHLGMEMSPHTTQAIGVVERYFGSGAVPTIAQQFTPGRGWQPDPLGERVSRPLVRALAAEGVTAVALAYDGRLADFRVQELLTAAPSPVNRTVR